MYSLGPYPAVQLGNDGKVYCEVYEVNEAVLADLDHLEGVARDFYQREQIDTELGECFIYTMKDVHGYPRVDSGHWGEAA